MGEQETKTSEYPQYTFSTTPDSVEGSKNHSKLGIASFIIGLASVIIFVVAIIAMISIIMTHNEFDSNSFTYDVNEISTMLPTKNIIQVTLAGLAMLFSFVCCIVGLILGIVGVCTKGKYKSFPIIGIIVNALLPVGFISLFLIGLAAGGRVLQ